MKKKHINLGKKLTLNKETIAALDSGQMGFVAGGATITNNCCMTQTCPANSAPCNCIESLGCPSAIQCPVTNNPADTQCQGGTATDIRCCLPATINGPNC